MSQKYHDVIGIDLGTTYSAVAVFNSYSEQAEILRNPEEGLPDDGATTPSVISLHPITRKAIVGWAAKRNVSDPKNTIIEIKREMGEVFREDTLDIFGARGKYRPVENREGGYRGDPVRVEFAEDWRLPQEISAFTLMKMKQIAEHHLKREVRDAVITVPAYFTARQKKATEDAALLAGLYPRQLIPEPTAAAICYGVSRMEPTRRTYMVYDLGGGTFDVSIIVVEESKIDVIATSGDPRLGGGDFDDAITAWAVKELLDNHQLDGSGNREKRSIKAQAEVLKKQLSSFTTSSMGLFDVFPQAPTLEMTREKLMELIGPKLNKSLTFVDQAIASAEKKGVRRTDIDAILLVGGSSRIPKVKELLLDHFQREEAFVRADLDPDAVVAKGAAVLALRFAPSTAPFDIAKRPDKSMLNVDLEDGFDIGLITEHSLGIGVQNNIFCRIIDQGTSIPVSKRQSGFTNGGPTPVIPVPVYQGEGAHVYENTLIGTVQIGPMEPKPENFHQFEVTFALDLNGLLAVTVHHLNEGKSYQGEFHQEVQVGGVEALKALRDKLVKIYSDAPVTAAAVPVSSPQQPVAPPRGASAPAAAQPTAPPQQAAAQAAAPLAATSLPPQPGQTAPVPAAALPSSGPIAAPAEPAWQPQPVSPPAQAIAAAASAGASSSNGDLIEPRADVPPEFKSIVRRAQKMLIGAPNPQLRESFNRFTTLLNSGTAGDELAEAGDELENVYHDCR